MMKELGPRGRRTKSASINIRRLKREARINQTHYDAPPLPRPISPEERLDWERFIKPNIEGMASSDEVLKTHLKTVRDFYQMRRDIFFGRIDETTGQIIRVETSSVVKEFTINHPELEKLDVASALKPAFDLIRGRFEQAGNTLLFKAGYRR